jgi:hypothetical protein
MMLDFPVPTLAGQKFKAQNGVTYTWDGLAWYVSSADLGGGGAAYELPPATVAALGGVFASSQPDANNPIIGINESGAAVYGPIDFPVDSVNGMTGDVVIPPYVLPAATETTLGGVTLGPIMYASVAVSQTIANNSFTKVTLGNEALDTSNSFTNSRFQPTVPGYYLVTGGILGQGSAFTSMVETTIYRNGIPGVGGSLVYSTGGYISAKSNVVGLVYLNGSSDYVELYARLIGSGTLSIDAGFLQAIFQRG